MKNLETLEQFKNRVYSFSQHSIYSNEVFETNINLTKKIKTDGKMCRFVGNTMVFPLSAKEISKISVIQKELELNCSNLLAEKLLPQTLHMTLHDLENGEPCETLEMKIDLTNKLANEKLKQFKILEIGKIKMQSTWIFNMVNTSVVLGLEPCSEEDCFRLMWLFDEIQEIFPLNYPLTPHITLAYYKPNTYYSEDISKLKTTIEKLNEKSKIHFEFDVQNLVLQRFENMNNYFYI